MHESAFNPWSLTSSDFCSAIYVFIEFLDKYIGYQFENLNIFQSNFPLDVAIFFI